MADPVRRSATEPATGGALLAEPLAPLSASHAGEILNEPQNLDDKFTYEAPEKKPYPTAVGFCRRNIFVFWVLAVLVATVVFLTMDYLGDPDDMCSFIENCKMVSVPLVCLAFTWFHVWLALQMMFFPLNFWGIGQPIVPECVGLPINGWQGIVPRKAETMARRACETMIGNVVTIEEFMDRIQPDDFFAKLEDVMTGIVSETLERIVMKRWPKIWAALPKSVQAEMKLKVMQDMKVNFAPALQDLRTNINSILDIKEMSIDVFVKNPALMVSFFRDAGARELVFIQHFAAVMGFAFGCVQVGLYIAAKGVTGADYYILPTSGLIIGYLTNFLALKMTFAPVWPHHFCCGYINWQGVFLKRQKEASEKMAELTCKNVIDARKMLQYMVDGSPEGLDKVLALYQKHVEFAIDSSISIAKGSIPIFIGQGVDDIKKEVLDITLEILPQHTDAIERYMDEAMKVQETLSWRLSRLQPPEFEDIIHPIFQDDEWILLLVGAILGVIIGLLQAFALTNIGCS